MKILLLIILIISCIIQVQARTKECYQQCSDNFELDVENPEYETCKQISEYCPPTCQDLEDIRFIAECMGECMFYDRESCPEIKSFIKCIDTCEFEIKPYQMTKEQLDEFKEQLKVDPILHPGSTFQPLDCDPNKPKKKAVIQKSHTGASVFNYFLTRCDYEIIQAQRDKKYFKYDFKWMTYRGGHYYKAFDPSKQIINHIQNIKELIGYKHNMLKTFRDYDQLNLYNFTSEDFHFQSYTFDIKSTQYNKREQQFMDTVKDGLWITKQPVGSLGNGITLWKDVNQMKQKIKEIKSNPDKEYEASERISQFGLVQQYLHNPLLVNMKKNDMRNYILIASLEPLVVLYQHGFIRTCIEDYDGDNFENFDQNAAFKHLTNRSFQEKHPDYELKKHKLLILPEEFEEIVMKEKGVTREYIQETLYEEVKKISAYAVLSAQKKMLKQKGIFQILGGDFIFDENFKTWLIEINMSAGLFNNVKAHKYVIPQLVQTMLDLILQTYDNPEKSAEIWKHPEDLYLGKWEILINEATGYNILDKYKNTEKQQKSDL